MSRALRVVTLLPSATEMVCAVGARELLVGVSHECDHPPDLPTLPTLTRTRESLPEGSGEIDRSLRDLLTQSLSVFELEVDALVELEPDVIVTQALCSVCAVSLDEVRQGLARLLPDVALVSCQPTRLGDVWEDMRRVGLAVGRAQQADTRAGELQAACEGLGVRAAAAGHRPRVLTIEWLDPVMVGGTWMPELVGIAGGEALGVEAGQHAPTLSLDELRALEPELVLIKPCGFDLAATRSELELLRTQLPWDAWDAAREGRIYLADGNQFFNRPGPRLLESAEILAAITHPELFGELAAKHSPSLLRVCHDLSIRKVAGSA